jgi:hypothetical protein
MEGMNLGLVFVVKEVNMGSGELFAIEANTPNGGEGHAVESKICSDCVRTG